MGDMLADAVVAVLLQTAGEPLAVAEAEEARRRAADEGDVEAAARAELAIIGALMTAQFGQCQVRISALIRCTLRVYCVKAVSSNALHEIFAVPIPFMVPCMHESVCHAQR